MENQMENRFEQRSTNFVLPRQEAGSTMRNIVFLLLSFPMGLIYFLLTIIGFSVGIGSVVIWVGIPILFITIFSVRALAEVERRMVSGLLCMPMPYQLSRSIEPRRGFLRCFGRMLRDPFTWTSTVYMILKLPIGIISFTLALVLTIVSASQLALPLIYLTNVFIDLILATNGIVSNGTLLPGFIEVHNSFEWLMFVRSFIGIPLGIVIWIGSRFLLNGLALMSGELARALLGPGLSYIVAQPQTANEPVPRTMEEQRMYME